MNVSCPILGYCSKSTMHALILCPIAIGIWKNIKIWKHIRGARMESFIDCCYLMRSVLSDSDFEYFIISSWSIGINGIIWCMRSFLGFYCYLGRKFHYQISAD